MSEKEYIAVSDLARVRMMMKILGEIQSKNIPKGIGKGLAKMNDRLYFSLPKLK